ncbi:MAG: mechanosensitive ion channel [Desulfobacteraceae bacterium]|nr:mechanosensitive ion channel [Desulfobacteraceae bacterium]
MKKKNFRCCGVFMCFLMLLAASQVFGQTGATGTEGEKVFKIEQELIDNLKDIIPDEKLKELENFKDKEFSETQLSAALKGSVFSSEETETVLNYVREHLKFVEAVKKSAPVAMLMHKTKKDIRKKEGELESSQQDEQKKKVSDELGRFRKQLKKHEQNFSKITTGIDGGKIEQVSDILKVSGYKSEEIEIISDYLLKEALVAKEINTLSEMVQSIDAIGDELQQYGSKLEKAKFDEEKKSISRYIEELNDRLQKTKNDFSIITTGIDYSTFFKKKGKEVSWKKELKEIFSPIIIELKETTERPRKMEKLRSQMLYYEKRLPQIKKASEDIDRLLEKVTDKKVIDRLDMWKKYWNQMEKEFTTQKEAAQHQFFEEERGRKSVLTSFRVFFDSFVRHRGKNLFFAFLAFFAIYILFRLLQRIIWKISPIHRSPKYMFWANLVDVMFYVLTFLAATGALLAVLFTSGDWLILAIVMLLVLGIIWGARNTLPQFYDQIKLLLGFGTVRHGEKIIIDGISYKVEMMGVYTYLTNPLLTGGTIRLPLKDLVEMRSRPYDEKEAWFPCEEGDWVLVNGTAWRQVNLQTPEVIKLTYYEMHDIMPTKTFLNHDIRNLSVTPFWTGFSFEIAYKHRYEAMDEICRKLTEMTEEEVKKESWAEFVISPWIDFENFGDSSLILTYWIQMKKEAGSKYSSIRRTLRKIALKAANKYNWEIIKFEHISLHQPDNTKGLLENRNSEE